MGCEHIRPPPKLAANLARLTEAHITYLQYKFSLMELNINSRTKIRDPWRAEARGRGRGKIYYIYINTYNIYIYISHENDGKPTPGPLNSYSEIVD